MVLDATVYECPECGQRTAVHYAADTPPSVWCDCGRERMMERVEEVESVHHQITELGGI